MKRTSPNVFRSLQNNNFLRVAHDDLDNLIHVEGTVDWMKRVARVGTGR